VSKHAPNLFSRYESIHETVMAQMRRGGFVVSDALVFTPLPKAILLEGTIDCQGQIRIDVRKRLDVLDDRGDDPLVQTIFYSYNVALAGRGTIFRYDSPHQNHRRFHHVHRYDVLSDDTEGTVERVPEDDWPTLGEVILEAQDWYYEHYDALQSP
jgi:hypothetical protein